MTQANANYPIAMTIAGSDSSGGAGIQADLKTFAALTVYGTSALTALTAQNRHQVNAVVGLDPDFVRDQILTTIADMPVRAAKTGMLFSAPIIAAVQNIWQTQAGDIQLVVDPVMVATSGARLLDASAVQAMKELCRHATLITPNIPEAAVLLNREGLIKETQDAESQLHQMEDTARQLGQHYSTAVLLKGGHLRQANSSEIVNIFYDGSSLHQLRHPVVQNRSVHGTGCTLSAAIAAGLARQQALPQAIESALDYLMGALRASPEDDSSIGLLWHHWR